MIHCTGGGGGVGDSSFLAHNIFLEVLANVLFYYYKSISHTLSNQFV